jgi:hypothetical protein
MDLGTEISLFGPLESEEKLDDGNEGAPWTWF